MSLVVVPVPRGFSAGHSVPKLPYQIKRDLASLLASPSLLYEACLDSVATTKYCKVSVCIISLISSALFKERRYGRLLLFMQAER